ncbi:MAG: hypothetical protein K6T31_01105 [Alicyclobacillus sp.]|nr:hypothetical protein [Alicyclobacillus sp.]
MTHPAEVLAWVQYCPHCGSSLADPRNLVNEFSEAGWSVCFWWCRACGERGEVLRVTRVVAPQAASE